MSVGPDLSKLSISQLHELTGRDRRWIKRTLARAGVEPAATDGRSVQYPTRDALTAIYGKSTIDAGDELAGLNRAKRELAELDLAERRGELAPISDMEREVVRLLSGIRTQILAVPAATAQELAVTEDAAECHGILETALHNALTALADAKITTSEKPRSS